jgi:hypothetical protein
VARANGTCPIAISVHALARLPRRPSERVVSALGGNSPVGSSGCRNAPALGIPSASATW